MNHRDSKPVLGVLYCPTCEQEEASGEHCPRDGTRLVRLAADRDPLVGRKLDDRFTIEEKLGAGGMGSVYRARQHSVGRDVAIKVVNPGLVTDPMATKRFLREAKLASRLSHPNVVSVLDFGQTADGLFYLVMELVHGRTLHAALLEEGRLKLDRVVRIASQICDALEGAHALPIMHRDLKPANIMLLSAGRDLVKVLDFGLAKSLAIDETSSTMTSAGALLGTPTFMPPEVANGDSYDERADLYSLGCILYLLVAGRPPFVTDSVPEMISLHGSAIPEPVTDVPAAFAHLIAKLLSKSPDARYPSAAAVRTALEEALAGARSGGLLDARELAVASAPTLVPASRDTLMSSSGLSAEPASHEPSDESMTARRFAVADPTLAPRAENSAPVAASGRARVGAAAIALDGTSVERRPRRRVVAIASVVCAAAAIGGVIAYTTSRRAGPPASAPAIAAPADARTSALAPVEPAVRAPADAAVAPTATPPLDAAGPAPDAGAHHATPARPGHGVPHAAPVDAGAVDTDAPF